MGSENADFFARVKTAQAHVSRRSSENITNRDQRSAKKVIAKIKLELESYGINTEVILNEIDLLEPTMASPRKSSEANKDNSTEQRSTRPSTRPMLTECDTNNSKTFNENGRDFTDVSLPSCFSNSVMNAIEIENLPLIDLSDPFINFEYLSSTINQNLDQNIQEKNDVPEIASPHREKEVPVNVNNPEFEKENSRDKFQTK